MRIRVLREGSEGHQGWGTVVRGALWLVLLPISLPYRVLSVSSYRAKLSVRTYESVSVCSVNASQMIL